MAAEDIQMGMFDNVLVDLSVHLFIVAEENIFLCSEFNCLGDEARALVLQMCYKKPSQGV